LAAGQEDENLLVVCCTVWLC